MSTRPDQVRLDECLARYWLDVGQDLPSAEQCKLAIRHLDPEVAGMTVADLNSSRIKQIGRAWRDKRSNKNGTVSHKLSVLRAALNYNVREKFLDEAPFIADLPKAPSRDRVLSLEEMAAVWRSIPLEWVHMHRYFLLLVGTGSRRSALMTLKRDQIDFEKRLIKLNPDDRVQTDKRRPTLPLPPVILPWLSVAPPGYVCGVSPERPLSKSTLDRNLRTIMATADLKGVRSHTFRHTMATMLAENDVSEFEIARYGGWQWSKTTAGKYAHHRPGYLGSAVAVIDDALKQIGRLAGRPIECETNLRSPSNRANQ